MTNTVGSIWKKIRKSGPDDCWLWTGYRNEQGYGRIDIMGREGVYAHRVAYLAANPGAITLDCRDNLYVLHRCDNPPCCNPAHLFLGTHQDNMDDKIRKGRQVYYKSTESPRAKLTEEDVFWIRMAKKHGATVKALAYLHDVSRSTIGGCLYGRHYKDV